MRRGGGPLLLLVLMVASLTRPAHARVSAELDGGRGAPSSSALDTADALLTSWRTVAEARGNTDSIRHLQQARLNVDATRALLGITRTPMDEMSRVVCLVEAGTAWQFRALGLEETGAGPSAVTPFRRPSKAVKALLSRHGVSPSRAETRDILALDDLERPARRALARLVGAFLTLDGAARDAYSGLDQSDISGARRRVTLREIAGASWLAESGASLGTVLVARNQLLEAATQLRADWSTASGVNRLPPRVIVPPVIALDLEGTNTTYRQDFALTIDVGGNDTYRNNAGGNGTWTFPRTPAAALVDLSGNDSYASGRPGGVNGGGQTGVGFLLDTGGNDRYTAGPGGTNGGGSLGGVGFLLDTGGNDRYTAGSGGTNGGGGDLSLAGGTGFLLDLAGDDVYTAGGQGTNGGGWFGSGFLFDGVGRDVYRAGNYGTNGAGLLGTGFLLDNAGNDRYTAGSRATNGGGLFGIGFLFDATGNDRYTARNLYTNGGGSGGQGMLLDAGGNDHYVAGNAGTNGGGADHNGAGSSALLLDASGNDSYRAGRNGVNGGEGGPDHPTGTAVPGRALLLDLGGRDIYSDRDGGAGKDCTRLPKGLWGAQVDMPQAGC